MIVSFEAEPISPQEAQILQNSERPFSDLLRHYRRTASLEILSQNGIRRSSRQHRTDGLRQTELAVLSGMSYAAIRVLESGAETNPTIKTVIGLANGLKLSDGQVTRLLFAGVRQYR